MSWGGGGAGLRQTVLVDHDFVASGPGDSLCGRCGKPVPEGNLAWDYPVPDPVAFLSEGELTRRTVFRSQRIISVIQPWPQVFGAWAQARVPGPDQAPRLVHSHDRLLAHVLTGSWPEDMIRSGRYAHEPADMTGGPTPDPYAG